MLFEAIALKFERGFGVSRPHIDELKCIIYYQHERPTMRSFIDFAVIENKMTRFRFLQLVKVLSTNQIGFAQILSSKTQVFFPINSLSSLSVFTVNAPVCFPPANSLLLGQKVHMSDHHSLQRSQH
mmetsp:Transcript_2801/g.5348  ORF Transcript_2801/g.5348 Transcript_2801/m.5348 type:complete len:126 (-) Transcript_2801:1446-1823(-)